MLGKRFHEILQLVGVSLLIALGGTVIYSNTFDVPFVFDDIYNIVENAAIRSLAEPAVLWHYDPSRFLSHYTFALNYFFGQFDVWGYHLVNLVVHLLTALAVYFFLGLIMEDGGTPPRLRSRRGWIVLLATLVFLCHPIQTQAVTYVSQRSTPLAALCYVCSLIYYFHFRKSLRWKPYALSLGFAAAGLFTKPIIVTLPLAILLCELMFLSRGVPRKKSVWAAMVPFFLMAVIVPALLILWRDKTIEAGDFLTITRESQDYSRGQYLLTQFNVIIKYLQLLVFPVNQKLDYDFPIAQSLFAFPTWMSFLAIAAILYLAFRLGREYRIVSFGIFWFFITLSLESSIFPISDVIFEHRLYLPMVGAALLAAYGLAWATAGKPKMFFVAGTLIVLTLGTLTYRRNAQWRNTLEFYQDMAQGFPDKARIHNNLGNYYADKKEWDKALEHYYKSLELGGEATGAYSNIANVHSERGEYAKAAEILEMVVRNDPTFPFAYYNLGVIHYQTKDYNKAMEYFQQTLKLNPNYVPAMVGIANIYASLNQLDKAKFYLEQSLAMNPGYVHTYEDLGHLYIELQQYNEAARYYEEALRRGLKEALVHNNLGNIYLMKGQDDVALEHYRKAIEIDSEAPQAYANAAGLLKKQGDVSQARAFYQKAFDLYHKQNDGMMMEKIGEELRHLN